MDQIHLALVKYTPSTVYEQKYLIDQSHGSNSIHLSLLEIIGVAVVRCI